MTALAELMKSANLTDPALADRVDCGRPMITKLRHGKAAPSLTLARKIAKEFGEPIEKVFPEGEFETARSALDSDDVSTDDSSQEITA